jgi:hypothetical protein
MNFNLVKFTTLGFMNHQFLTFSFFDATEMEMKIFKNL